MFFLKRLFKKSSVKKLLGGGLIYSEDQQKFYVDSNTYTGLSKKSVIIFRNEIRKVINKNFKDTSESAQLTDLEKTVIAIKVKKAMESEGFDVILSPELPLGFSIRNE